MSIRVTKKQLKHLIELGLTKVEIAERLGTSEYQVRKVLNLAGLSVKRLAPDAVVLVEDDEDSNVDIPTEPISDDFAGLFEPEQEPELVTQAFNQLVDKVQEQVQEEEPEQDLPEPEETPAPQLPIFQKPLTRRF
jgi:hypothetical protein